MWSARLNRVTIANAALVIVDVQAAALAMVGSTSPGELVANVVALTRVARVLGVPVLLAEAPFPGAGADRPPALTEAVGELAAITHAANDAWPALRSAVEATGRTGVVLAGIATDVGVGLTALAACAEGRPVLVATDACGTLTTRVEDAAWLRLAHAGVQLASWTAVAAELSGSYATAEGSQVLEIVRECLSLSAHQPR